MARRNTDHVRLGHGGRFICDHCHESYAMNMPAPLGVIVAASAAFAKEHGGCRPRPAPVMRTAEEWVLGNDVGNSSLTIWTVLTGRISPREFTPSVPWDPSDFGRCYRLLQVEPGWRKHLAEVAERYPDWTPLVARWDDLEQLYRTELAEGTGKAPRLYALLQELTVGARR